MPTWMDGMDGVAGMKISKRLALLQGAKLCLYIIS